MHMYTERCCWRGVGAWLSKWQRDIRVHVSHLIIPFFGSRTCDLKRRIAQVRFVASFDSGVGSNRGSKRQNNHTQLYAMYFRKTPEILLAIVSIEQPFSWSAMQAKNDENCQFFALSTKLRHFMRMLEVQRTFFFVFCRKKLRILNEYIAQYNFGPLCQAGLLRACAVSDNVR